MAYDILYVTHPTQAVKTNECRNGLNQAWPPINAACSFNCYHYYYYYCYYNYNYNYYYNYNIIIYIINIIIVILLFVLSDSYLEFHINRVCSTWGNFHLKTFDGEFFQLPSTCNYVLTSDCKNSYEDFNIQIRRQTVNGTATITEIDMKLEGAVVELTKTLVVVNGQE